jgi:hypothetical protein
MAGPGASKVFPLSISLIPHARAQLAARLSSQIISLAHVSDRQNRGRRIVICHTVMLAGLAVPTR